jgi:hypothetical protein
MAQIGPRTPRDAGSPQISWILNFFVGNFLTAVTSYDRMQHAGSLLGDLGLTSLIILGEGKNIIYAIGYNSTHASPPHRMQVNGQIPTPVALPLGKKPSISFNWRFAGPHGQTGRFGEEKNVLPQPGFGHGSTPSFLYNGYWVSFPGVKRPGRGVDDSPSSSAQVKNEWSWTSTPLPHRHGTLWGVLYLYLVLQLYETRK